MIAVSVSRVQSIGTELANAEDRAERQLTEKVATIAEDIIGELLQSRMKLTEAEEQAEMQPLMYDMEESEAHRARMKRCLSFNGPLTNSELRELEISRPNLLRRRLVHKAGSRVLEQPRKFVKQEQTRKPSALDNVVRKLSTHGSRPRLHSLSDKKKIQLSDSEEITDGVQNLRSSFDSLHKKATEILAKRRSSIPGALLPPLIVQETRFSTSEDQHVVKIDDGAKEAGSEPFDEQEPSKKPKSAIYKQLKAAIWSSIGMIAYCLLGGLFVSLIESPYEEDGRAYKNEQHQKFVSLLLNELNISSASNDSLQVGDLVRSFEEDMISALKSTVPDGEPTWTFVRSWFFSWTVVTAIGYGNYTPVTQLGRVWVMVFGMLGIPLVVLNSMRFGSLFTQLTIVARNRILSWCRRRMRKCPDDMSVDDLDTDESEEYMPPWVAVTLLPAYCAIMAAIFCTWEPWDYFDSFYFTFVTLAGIGLGDIAPSREEVMMLFTVFMMIGLGLFAMFMEMGAMQFIKLGKRIKHCCAPYGKHAKAKGGKRVSQSQSSTDSSNAQTA